MSRFRKLTQTIWPCRYHLDDVPKYRHRLLDRQIAIEAGNCIKAILERKECESDMIRKYAKYQEQKEKRTEQKKLFDNSNHGTTSHAPLESKADLPLPGLTQSLAHGVSLFYRYILNHLLPLFVK